MHPPPTDRNVTNPAEKSVSILVKTFFFFLETTWFWAKKTFKFPISAEKSLSTLVKTSEFLRFWLQIPPHQNFLDPPLHTAQFFCRALAALRIVEIIITKLTHYVKCNKSWAVYRPLFFVGVRTNSVHFFCFSVFCIYASKILYSSRFFDYDKII